MENIIITSRGFTVNDFAFESFTVARGEYLSIDFHEIHDFEIEKTLYEILSGKSKLANVSAIEEIAPAITPLMKSGPAFFRKTSFKYLKEKSLLSDEKINFLLKKMDIDPRINIYKLGANERKLLSLEAAYSKSKNIVICTSDLDYAGIERVRERVAKELGSGSLIEINFPNSKGREYLFSDLGTRHKKIIVKSSH